jgi:glycosyltransferase involved in cell wall biosynthesis
LKVLIYTHSFAPNIGGVETYALLLASGLSRMSTKGGDTEGIFVTVVTPTPRRRYDDTALPFRVIRSPNWMGLLKSIQEADVVHLAGPCFSAMLLGYLLRKPTVIEHHGYQAVCPNGLLFFEPTKTACPGHFMSRRYDKCLRCVAAEVGLASSIARVLGTFPRRWLCNRMRNAPITEHVLRRINLSRSKVIYYGIEDVFMPPQADSGSQWRGDLTFGYVGRLVREKGLTLLIEACERLKNAGYKFSLKFIGDGPERPVLEEMTRRLGLAGRTVFTGYLQSDMLSDALRDVSVVVMPTLMEETSGLAVMEQMMRGRMVVVSDIGGLSEVVGDTGLKFIPGDAASLASQLRCTLDDRDLISDLGQKARARAEMLFLKDRMLTAHVALYNEMIRPSGTDR